MILILTWKNTRDFLKMLLLHPLFLLKGLPLKSEEHQSDLVRIEKTQCLLGWLVGWWVGCLFIALLYFSPKYLL